MKERPILFSTPMVQAILDGRKTVTRRALKGMAAEIFWGMDEDDPKLKEYITEFDNHPLCPYGQPGDILWVRETFYAYGYWSLLDGKWTLNDSSTQYEGYRYMENPPHEINDAPRSLPPEARDRFHPSRETAEYHRRRCDQGRD